jgi:AcrR family transcriptional regulator
MQATSKTGTRTPRGQGDLLRERLIETALALLDGGQEPANISIRGVAKAAGVSPTAFYLHFDSRGQFMRTLVERGFADLRQHIGRAAARSADPEVSLLDAGIAYMAFAREQPERYRLIFSIDWDEHEIKKGPDDGMEVADAAFDDLVLLIERYFESIDRQPGNTDNIALGMWAGLHGYATLCHAEPGVATLTDEKFASLLAGAWLKMPPEA